MNSTEPKPTHYLDKQPGRSLPTPSRILFFVMLALIVIAFAAFVVLGPMKGGGNTGGGTKAKAIQPANK